jgi:hypothetical protein
MPRRRSHRGQDDSLCLDVFIFSFLLWAMVAMWNNSCSWYFNQYTFSAYTFMSLVRRYQSHVIDSIETDSKA